MATESGEPLARPTLRPLRELYVEVDDPVTSLARAQELGASVVLPVTEFPETGGSLWLGSATPRETRRVS